MTFQAMLLLAAAPADADAEKVFPILDAQYFIPQLFWLGVTFALLYILLARVFLPVVGQTLEDRSSRIADDMDAATRMQRDAEAADAAHTQSLRDARAKAASVAEATRASVDDEIARETAQADAEADRAALAAEERIRDIRASAMSNIDSVASETASAIVAKLTGKSAAKAPRAKTKRA